MARQFDATNHVLLSLRADLAMWKNDRDGMARANRRLQSFTDAMPGVRTLLIFDATGKVCLLYTSRCV